MPKRKYKDFDETIIQEAILKVKRGQLSLRGASRDYGIPLGTLHNRNHGKHGNVVGAPTRLAVEEEKAFVEHTQIIAEWGHLVTTRDLRCLIKDHLDKKGVLLFTDNYAGRKWLSHFLSRYKRQLRLRTAENVKSRRFNLDREEMRQFFTNLQSSLEGILPSNLLNYDETAMSDNPGKIKALFKKGVKYPERNLNSSKANVSVMFCGSASGNILPPFVVYKSAHICDRWKERGPNGTWYMCTKSGWFDAITFTEFFRSIVLPYRRKHQGKFAVIGDNLSSHFTEEVIQLAKDEDIKFIFLPANSTHLTQPLDVSYFRPLKGAWRKIIEEWKKKNPSIGPIPKSEFPALLKNALTGLEQSSSKNLISGFKATGIYPLDANQVLKKMPNPDFNITSHSVSDTFVDHLKVLRTISSTRGRGGGRGRRCKVQPGRSVAEVEDNESDIEIEPGEDEGSDDDLLGEEAELARPLNPVNGLDNRAGENQDKENLEEGASDHETSTTDDQSHNSFSMHYAIVKCNISNASRIIHFVCQLNSKDSNHDTYEGTFFKKVRGQMWFVEPELKRQFEIPGEDVICRLPDPQIDRRSRLSFPYDFRGIEMA